MPYRGLPHHIEPAFLSFKGFLIVIGRDGDVWQRVDGGEWKHIAGPAPVFSISMRYGS
jgi:hypothetical protein